jgi:putative ATP-binding cassette transporter
MNLLRLLRVESRISPARLFAVATLSGLSNALILAIINDSAQRATDDAANFRGLVLFAIVLTLYIVSQKHILVTSTAEIERILDSIRVRIAEKILRSDLLPLERIGRATIYASVSKETLTISQAAAIIVIACQAAILTLFTLLYLAWLSLAAFALCLLLTAVALSIHFARIAELNRDLHEAMVRENRFVDALGDLLDGFKEIKLNRRRSDEVFSSLRQISASVADIKTRTQTQFSIHFIFSQISFYLLIAAIVFLLPRLSPTYGTVLTKATAAILFLIGPIGNLIGSIPTFAGANAAVENIYSLEARLDRLAEDGGAAPRASAGEDALSAFSSIELDQVFFRFEGQGEGAFAVGPIDLVAPAGQLLFIVGGNGSGKSTLLKLLTALYHPTSGTIKVDGVPVGADGVDAYRSLFSAIFSDYHLFSRLYGLGEVDRGRVDELLELLELSGKTRLVDGRFETLELSNGQRKRLALLVMLLEDRPVLVLDEWAADQDPAFRRFFYEDLLSRLKREGKTVIAVTHDDRYFGVADRVIKMEYGKVVAADGGSLP